MALDPAFLNRLQGLLGPQANNRSLNGALRLLAKHRAMLLEQHLVKHCGTVIGHGPFAGMDYPVKSAEGARLPRLLGIYESTLAPILETIIDRSPALVIDIGAAEGYYAVGMARRLPLATIWARDANAAALALCTTLAQANGVGERVQTGGPLSHGDLDICAQQRSAIICDIEGAEDDLLDPVAAPGLRHADILVECHPMARPEGLIDRICDRFATSHTITQIDRGLDGATLPPVMDDWSDMDRLLVLWEWRAGPTPWLWMQARN